MQSFTNVTEDMHVAESRQLLMDNILTVMSNFSGADFPVTHLQEGMSCWRTDLRHLYTLESVNPVRWGLVYDANADQTNILVAKGAISAALNFDAASYQKTGIWEIALDSWAGSTKAPTDAASRGTLITLASSEVRNQIYIDRTTGISHQRSFTGTQWASWFRYLNPSQDSLSLIHQFTNSGTANAGIGAVFTAIPVTALRNGVTVMGAWVNASTSATPTLKIGDTQAREVKRHGGLALDSGNLSGFHIFRYSEAYDAWIVLNPVPTPPPILPDGTKNQQVPFWNDDVKAWEPGSLEEVKPADDLTRGVVKMATDADLANGVGGAVAIPPNILMQYLSEIPALNQQNVQYVAVGAGGAGGAGTILYNEDSSWYSQGGGGAGGQVLTGSLNLIKGERVIITVGAGGANSSGRGSNGAPSSITGDGGANIVSSGGGAGASGTSAGTSAGGAGGGGAAGASAGGPGAGILPGGYSGGAGAGGAGGGRRGGGGGGAGGAGGTATLRDGYYGTSGSGAGGIGRVVTIRGVSEYFGGGGSGGVQSTDDGNVGAGGAGGGGMGGRNGNPSAGAANTGGGGGGGCRRSSTYWGAAGGSGIVILRVPSNKCGTITGTYTTSIIGADTVITFTGSGTYTHSV